MVEGIRGFLMLLLSFFAVCICGGGCIAAVIGVGAASEGNVYPEVFCFGAGFFVMGTLCAVGAAVIGGLLRSHEGSPETQEGSWKR